MKLTKKQIRLINIDFSRALEDLRSFKGSDMTITFKHEKFELVVSIDRLNLKENE